ncbi:MAG: hypothetical protein H7177_16080 [Rhizobacter sp.]|nr:hypothetical protein [Bacteriovorax sp.]
MKIKFYYSFLVLTLVATLGFFFINTNNPYEYHYQVVKKKIDQDELAITIKFYEKRLERNPTGYQDMGILAGLYLESAKTTGVETYFEKAESLALQSIKEMPLFNLQAPLVLADLYQARHQFNDAIEIANNILKQKGHYPTAVSILVKSNLALGNIVEGQKQADELIMITPDQSAFILRATLLGIQNRNGEAEWNFNHALALDDSEDPAGASYARVIFARFMSGLNKTKEAKLLLNEALRIDPQSTLALDQMGELNEKEHSYDEAINNYKKAFKLSNQLIYLFKESRSRLSAGELTQGTELLEQTEKLVRNEVTNKKTSHLNELVKILLLRRQKNDYVEALELAKKESLLRRNPETLTLLAESYLKNNNPYEAQKVIREMLAVNIYNDEILKLAEHIEIDLKNNSLAEVYRNYPRF